MPKALRHLRATSAGPMSCPCCPCSLPLNQGRCLWADSSLRSKGISAPGREAVPGLLLSRRGLPPDMLFPAILSLFFLQPKYYSVQSNYFSNLPDFTPSPSYYHTFTGPSTFPSSQLRCQQIPISFLHKPLSSLRAYCCIWHILSLSDD